MSEHDHASEDPTPETAEAPEAAAETEAPTAEVPVVEEEEPPTPAAEAEPEAEVAMTDAAADEDTTPVEEDPTFEVAVAAADEDTTPVEEIAPPEVAVAAADEDTTPVEKITPPEVAVAAVPEPLRPAISAQDLSELPDDVDFEEALSLTMLNFEEGDIVRGQVVAIGRDEVLVDIGFKSEGVIPLNELSIRKAVDPHTVVTVGEEIEALVLDKEDEEGRLILSKKRAQYERAWGRIEQIAAAAETVSGPVIEVVKGGLIVDIGLRGFLPASLVELRRVRDLDPYIGETIEAKVIEIDRNRNNVVLSRRAYLEEEQAEQRQAFLDDLAEGNVAEGVVSSVVNFGAFVDLGGMDGLVHVSELSYQHVNHPSEVVKVGDKVMVKVLEVDRDRERISLSIKQTQMDPWEAFAAVNGIGDIVDGMVTKTVPFGAFITVGDGVEGLVHVSEIAMHRVESPELELSLGQVVKVKITEMDGERRRVSLSIKQAAPGYQERTVEQPAARPAPRPRSEGPVDDDRPRRRRPRTREFEREDEKEKETEPSFAGDASLEAILQELKERGIGRR